MVDLDVSGEQHRRRGYRQHICPATAGVSNVFCLALFSLVLLQAGSMMLVDVLFDIRSLVSTAVLFEAALNYVG
jgi:hypothetical protein